MFGVYVEMDVYHDDRELEFIMVKGCQWIVQKHIYKIHHVNRLVKQSNQILIAQYGDRKH